MGVGLCYIYVQPEPGAYATGAVLEGSNTPIGKKKKTIIVLVREIDHVYTRRPLPRIWETGPIFFKYI